MAHFAQIDSNNIVQQVLVVPDEQEHRGHEFLASDLGLGGTWRQTSYTASMRKNFAGIGYTWDETRDAFIPPRPFASWLLNDTTCQWEAPVPYPQDGCRYVWTEGTGWTPNHQGVQQ